MLPSGATSSVGNPIDTSSHENFHVLPEAFEPRAVLRHGCCNFVYILLDLRHYSLFA